MPWTKKTAEQASRLLAKYEQLNSDLPRETRRQMAMFVLAPRVGKRALEELFDRPLGQTPHRHRSWLVYTAMRTSGIERHWPEFVACVNNGERIGVCYRALKSKVTSEEWLTFSRRLGYDKPLPYGKWYKIRPSEPRRIWTKGGIWDRGSNYTKIIILGESLERDYDFSTLTKALGLRGAAALERELHHTIDPDELLFPDAIRAAVAYVRGRIPQLAGWDISRASLRTASWFFQTRVPADKGLFHDFRNNQGGQPREPRAGKRIYWDWLPPPTDN